MSQGPLVSLENIIIELTDDFFQKVVHSEENMQTYLPLQKKHNDHRSTANKVENSAHSNRAVAFTDHRPLALTQRKLQESADLSTQSNQQPWQISQQKRNTEFHQKGLPVQAKWWSNNVSKEDIDWVAYMVSENNYIGAFDEVVDHHPSQKGSWNAINLAVAKKGEINQIHNFLKKTYQSATDTYTPEEIVSQMETHFADFIANDPDVDEEFRASNLSPQEKGLKAVEEIQQLTRHVKDAQEFAGYFETLAHKYGMQDIRLNSDKDPWTVWFKINPEFEVQLSGAHAIEMRSVGSSTGNNQTRVKWTPQTLSLSATGQTGGGNYTVGGNMLAYPLGQDHTAGTDSTADSDHGTMMGKIPSKNNRKKTGSGSGPYYYIKGHLLNGDLGGIANEANLFPITQEANGQHKNYVEQYIKNGIAQGYVYRYEVDIQNVSTDYDTGLNLYSVDSDLAFSFARLDTAQKDISGTVHTGKIRSRYENTGAEPFDKNTEYTTDYNGSYNNPKAVGGEDVNKVKEKGTLGTNTGLVGNVNPFTMGLPLGSSTLGSSTMSLDSSATLIDPAKKLSLRKSQANNIIDFFDSVIKGWNKTSITAWITDVQTKGYSKWDDVFLSAKSQGMDASLPALIQSNNYLTRVSINGAAIGT